MNGVLPRAFEDDETPPKVFGRVQACPLDVTTLGVDWGLSGLGRLYRARSLERLDRTKEAVEEYARVARESADAGSGCRARLEEARAGAARLGRRP